MRGIGVLHLMPRRQIGRIELRSHHPAHRARQVVDTARLIGAHVEDLVVSLRPRYGLGDNGRDVADVAERTRLFTIAKDGQGIALEDFIHEDPDHVPVFIPNVLPLAVNIVRAENDEVQAKQFMGGVQVQFDGVLGNAVRTLRRGNRVLRHGQLVPAVNRDGGSEDEALHVMVHRGVDQVHAAEQVVVVVKPPEFTLALNPPDKSSKARTESPRLMNSLATWEPMKPAAPVTSIFLLIGRTDYFRPDL